MMRHFLTTLIALSFISSFTACSLFSGDKKDEASQETSSSTDDLGDDSLAEGENTDTATAEGTGDAASSEDDLFAEEGSESSAGSDTTAAPAEGEQAAASGSDGLGSDAAFPETPLGDTAATPETTASDVAAAATDLSSTSSSDTGLGGTDSTSTLADAGSTSTTETTSTETTSDTTSTTNTTSAPAPVPTLKKVEASPIERGGVLLNRVYVARAGDTLSTISTKIYGSDRAKEMKKWNPSLKSRKIKVGDKIYYTSPKSPEDQAMLTYYEENGIPALTYVTKEGDNIRSLSKNWLGHSRSWMEVYSTNPQVESKGDLPAGVEIRYWPQDSSGAVASTEATPPADASAMPPADQAATDASGMTPPADPSAPTGDLAAAPPSGDLPPPPDAPPMDATMPPADLPPPPPPPPAEPTADASASADDVAADENLMLYVMVALGVLGLILVFMIIRRKKNRPIDLGQTQV